MIIISSNIKHIPTPHIEAVHGQIAEKVLMPGDPLRAKFIAENYLTELKCYNKVRNMLGYTGIYKGERLSVQGSGMGMPSMGIYSYELYNYYNVQQIIRIGTAGAISDDVFIKDVILAVGACTNSNYSAQFNLPGMFSPIASFTMLQKAFNEASAMSVNVKCGNVLSSDTFYDDSSGLIKWRKMGVLAVEMEAAALYMNAARCGKDALCVLTISDCPFTGESTSSEQRETSFLQMIEIALNV